MEIPTSHPSNWIESLANMLQEQLPHYEAIRELARQQHALIAAENPDALLKILTIKQEHIHAISQIDARAQELRTRWDQEHDNLSSALRAPMEKVGNQLRAILAEIVALEEKDRAALESTKSGTAAELTRMQKGKAVLKAYGANNVPPIARYKDDHA